MNVKEKVQQYEDQIINDLKGLLSAIENMREMMQKHTKRARWSRSWLRHQLSVYEIAHRDGFTTHDVDHIAGRIKRKGNDVLGILCHVDVVVPFCW